MNFLKRAITLTIALALCLVPAARVLALGHAPLPTFSGGDGSQESPFLISGADELYSLASLVDSGEDCAGLYFMLTEDIALDGVWTPIGNERTAFSGVFSGGGHTVSGVFTGTDATLIFAGLFGRTAGGAVTDVSVTGSAITGSQNVGGIIGAADGTETARVSFSGTVRGDITAGGVVGLLSGGSVSDSCFDGAVYGTRSTGGIYGSGENSAVSHCASDAEVRGNEYAGGIGGISGEVRLAYCTSRGSVEGVRNTGGLLGFCFDSSAEYCTSSARVSGIDMAAGVSGTAQTSSFIGCENLGSISAERFTGGIGGFCCGCSFTGCANRGPVSADDYVGGIMGWSDDGADFGDNGLENTLAECMNTGGVTGQWGVGGIIGDAHNAFVFDCFNTGAIASIEYAGGLTGYTAESKFVRCYNIGAVTSDSFAGGVVGKVSYAGSVFESCLYLGSCCASEDPYGIARDEFELLDEASYTGFDFGSVWSLAPCGYPYARLGAVPPPLPLLGDTDGDGSITSIDALSVLRYSLDILPLSPMELFRSDIDGDGITGTADALLILRASIGI